MRRVSTKSWPCSSAVRVAAIVLAVAIEVAISLPASAQLVLGGRNELFLARLQPGKDTLPAAAKLFGGQLQKTESTAQNEKWTDPCTGRTVTLEANAQGVIQEITMDYESKLRPACTPEMYAASERELFWQTGHGVKLGDSRQHLIEMYGKPGSTSPSAKNGRELELLYYAFDWAGSNVPQVMEVSCERATGRVVEILLAYPSL